MQELPPPTDARNLTGIFSIMRHHNYDEIRVGNKIVGDLCESITWQGDTERATYTFYAFDDAKPFQTRNSYAECWVDVLATIANNQTLAIEFAIKVNQKTKKEITIESLKEPASV